jgi:hypothetical protein
VLRCKTKLKIPIVISLCAAGWEEPEPRKKGERHTHATMTIQPTSVLPSGLDLPRANTEPNQRDQPKASTDSHLSSAAARSNKPERIRRSATTTEKLCVSRDSNDSAPRFGRC